MEQKHGQYAEEFNGLSGKVVKLAEFKARSDGLRKAELSFLEKARYTLFRPLSLFLGYEEGLRIIFSKKARQDYRDATADGTIGHYKFSGDFYIQSDAVFHAMRRIKTHHPILVGFSGGLQNKLNGISVKALEECRDHRDDPLRPMIP